MKRMFMLHFKHAFSDAPEGAASTIFFARSASVSIASFLLPECSQPIVYLIYKFLLSVVCTKQLNFLDLSLLHCLITINGK